RTRTPARSPSPAFPARNRRNTPQNFHLNVQVGITEGKLAVMTDDRVSSWPPHGVETLPWQQQVRGGIREDRMMRSVDATIPSFIRELDYMPPLPVMLDTEKALLAVAQADTDAEGHSAALSRFMVRSESAASSKIERINASA